MTSTIPTVVLDPNAHSHAASAFSWVLQGKRETARAYLADLTDTQLDEVMTAAAILVALAGGL